MISNVQLVDIVHNVSKGELGCGEGGFLIDFN